MTATVVPQNGARGQRRRRPRPGRAIVIVVVLSALVAGSWWWSHPGLFLEPGNGVGGETAAGVPLYIGMADVPAHESIHLVDAEPRVVSSRGSVQAQVLVCRILDGGGVGAVHDVTSLCESLRPPVGRAQGNDQLVLEVFSDEAGAVAVDGIDVTYRTPYQRGTQTTGPAVDVTITP